MTSDNERHDSHGEEGGRRDRDRPRVDEPVMVKRGESGIVKWFSFKSGYGFIAIDNSDEEVFVHSSSIVTLRKVSSIVLHEGDKVEFDVIQGLKGLEAIAVTGPGGRKTGGVRFGEPRRPPPRDEKNGRPRGGPRSGGRRRSTSEEGERNDLNGDEDGQRGGEDGQRGGGRGKRGENGGGGRPRRAPRNGGKRSSSEKFVDAKESPEGGQD